VVPLFWTLLISTLPPKNWARSRIPINPKDLGLEICSSVIPFPILKMTHFILYPGEFHP